LCAMKSRNGSPDLNDLKLFHEAVGPVRRLVAPEPPTPPPPPPEPRQSRQDELAVLASLLEPDPDLPMPDTGEGLWFARPGVPERTLRKLRRGQFAVQAMLDLHGLTVAVAKPSVDHFISHCHAMGYQCIRIIHGKGMRSKAQGPILKRKLALWLQRRDDVLAYCSARQSDGGTGAVYVLLRRHLPVATV
jgi:DNA-nicking Smr family endonuclease